MSEAKMKPTHPLFWPGLPGSLESLMECTLCPSCSQNASSWASVASLGILEMKTCGQIRIGHDS